MICEAIIKGYWINIKIKKSKHKFSKYASLTPSDDDKREYYTF
jgi:hypothetical protein